MINKILLGDNEFELNMDKLPVLIHGADHAGASMFTISLAANLYSAGYKMLFLCGYHMAKDEFIKQVGAVDEEKAIFYTKDYTSDFIEKINSLQVVDDTIIFVKNIELFDDNVFDSVLGRAKIILSGDVNLCVSKDKILNNSYKSKILFTELENHNLPPLEKYKGYLYGENTEGVITTKIG